MAREHRLTFSQPVPGSRPDPAGYAVAWQGTQVMGIVNITPDSFSDGGHYLSSEAAASQARQLATQGALVVDLGAESTRPGAEPLTAEAELDRLRPVLRALQGSGLLLSVDTYKAEVAAAALASGAHLINDVSGLRDPEMVRVCAEAGVPAIVMHMQGTPQTMQTAPHYDDAPLEVFGALGRAAQAALAAGMPSVMLDPGIGFGKTLEHNLTLLRALPNLVALGYPVLLGASRKGLLRALTGVEDAAGRDPASLAAHLWGASAGVSLVRVHNVAAHVQALRVWNALAVGHD